MKIGIFLSARKPTDGGGYTITKDLFDSILKIYPKKNFYFIIRGIGNNYFKSMLQKNGFDYTVIKVSKFEIFIKSLITILFKSIFNFKDNLDNVLEINKIDCLIFLSSENFYPLKTPYVSTVWDIQHLTNPYFKETGSILIKVYRHIVLKAFLKNSKKIIVGTDVGKKEIKKFYKIDDNLFYKLPHPTPQIFFKAKKTRFNLKIFKKNNFFIYPANFWEHKNHILLLKAIKQINLKYKKKINLVLVGSIKNILHFNKIKKFIEINKLKKNIKILKFVSLKKLIQLYDYSEGLIYASSSGPENLPPLEAFARGKNVIISNYSGSKEQLNNFATYFNLKKKSSIEEKILNFKKFNSKDLKSYARLKSADSYIKNLIKNVERDFSV